MNISKGLEGVIAAVTAIASVDGENGHLVYRGHWAKDLAQHRSFEETAYLLWHGRLPDPSELAVWKQEWIALRNLPESIRKLIDAIPPEKPLMSVLQTVVAALSFTDSWPPSLEQAIALTALLPTIIAYRHRQLSKSAWTGPHPQLDHTANYLYMLTGMIPQAAHVEALNAYLVLGMEHGLNASTFTARVIASTESDMASAVSGAIGAMKGPLHGGAPSSVIEMFESIGSKENAEPWIRSVLQYGGKLMGFGHRVYKKEDPRAAALRDVCLRVAKEDAWLDLALFVEQTAIRLLEEYKPGRRLYTNVEFYAAAVMRSVEFPQELFTPTFSVSRIVGWTAHILEQSVGNRIYRPQSVYIGSVPDTK